MTAPVPAGAPVVNGSVGLGLDAGGTATRWALADASGQLLTQGSGTGLTALMMGSAAGRDNAADILARLALDVRAADVAATPQRVLAGFTGYSDNPPLRASLEALVAAAFGLPTTQVRVMSDIALAYLDCFAPGAGYLVSAGTGSIAATVEVSGQMHRVGGRGSLLDDAGSGHWIAIQALRQIWRDEDNLPGSWRNSLLARSVFAHIGGSEWSRSRDFIYQGTRGQIGELAVAVAAAAHQQDAVALRILRQAGDELALLGLALQRRFGKRPFALAGRVVDLHPAIEQNMRESLGNGTDLRVVNLQAHQTAARLAASNHRLWHDLTDAEPAHVMANPAGP